MLNYAQMDTKSAKKYHFGYDISHAITRMFMAKPSKYGVGFQTTALTVNNMSKNIAL